MQFVALEFLESFNFKCSPPQHRTCHDLESLALVVISSARVL